MDHCQSWTMPRVRLTHCRGLVFLPSGKALKSGHTGAKRCRESGKAKAERYCCPCISSYIILLPVLLPVLL